MKRTAFLFGLFMLVATDLGSAAADPQVPAHLAQSWAKCEETIRARFGGKVAIAFGPDTPRLDVFSGRGYLFGTVQSRPSHRFICELQTDGKTFHLVRVVVEP